MDSDGVYAHIQILHRLKTMTYWFRSLDPLSLELSILQVTQLPVTAILIRTL